MADKPRKKYPKKILDVDLKQVNTLPGYKELFDSFKKEDEKKEEISEELIQEMVEEVFDAMISSGKAIEIVTIKVAFRTPVYIEEGDIDWKLDELARRLLPDMSEGTFEMKGAVKADEKGTTLIMKIISDKVNLIPLLASLLEIVLEEEYTLEAIEILSGRALRA